MTITLIGIGIIALAIYADNLTLFRHDALPRIAFAGVLTLIASFLV